MAQFMGRSVAFGAAAILLGLALATPHAVAVEEMRDFSDSGTKAGKAKSCPKGTRYSKSKRGCVKTSCGTGQAWSSGVDACVDGKSLALTDDDLYLAGRDLGQEARYSEALQFFSRIKNRQQPRVLNSIGYATRKLGKLEEGVDYYHQALALDPNYTKARQYLGEAYLLKGDFDRARKQLYEIRTRCGGPCEDYELLMQAIVAYVTGEESTGW